MSTESDDNTWNMAQGDYFKHDIHAFTLHFPCVSCEHRSKDIVECCQFCRYYQGGKP